MRIMVAGGDGTVGWVLGCLSELHKDGKLHIPLVGVIPLVRPVKGGDDIKVVASISAGNDDLIGTMIADAIEKVGPDGVLSIESSSSFESMVEVEEGMEIDRGYISPQFVTNPENILVFQWKKMLKMHSMEVLKFGMSHRRLLSEFI